MVAINLIAEPVPGTRQRVPRRGSSASLAWWHGGFVLPHFDRGIKR